MNTSYNRQMAGRSLISTGNNYVLRFNPDIVFVDFSVNDSRDRICR